VHLSLRRHPLHAKAHAHLLDTVLGHVAVGAEDLQRRARAVETVVRAEDPDEGGEEATERSKVWPMAGMVLFAEPASAARMPCIALNAAGILGLKLVTP